MTEGIVTIAHEDQVTVPTATRMMVDTGDWARIRRNVEQLGEPLTERATTLASILVGAGLAVLGIAVATEQTSATPDPSLLTGLWVACAFCIFFALCFFLIGQRERQRYQVSNRAVCDDMDDIARRLRHEGLGVKPRAPKIGIKGQIERFWKGDRAPDGVVKPQA